MPRRLDHLRLIANLSPSERALAEYAKDSWNAENLVGVKYSDASSNRWIHFGDIPEQFRPLVKQWCRFLLARFAFSLGISRVHYLKLFLIWLVETHPGISTFADLTATHIDTYISYCRATLNAKGRERSDELVWCQVHAVKTFLEYLELNTHPLRTREPVQKVLGAHHLPISWSTHRTSPGQIKYIPERALQQFEQHIQDLAPHFIPLAIVLRATGWRISDVLLLKMDTCLEQTDKGWWICGDITKTQVLGHRVPVTKEVADVIEAQRALVKQEYPLENPKGYLFQALYGTRRKQGKPPTIRGVNNAFQRLARQHEIKGDDGKIFHFHTHAFRHTKAVELLNNGMSLTMVQQWMAHASPEMTLVYAKILDDTMHHQWEQTMKQGAVCMGPEGGKPQRVEGRKVLDVLSNNTLDVERVREHRIAVKLPIGNCCKTPKIICRFVELPCFNCPAYVLTPDDLPALEAYAQQIRQRIDIGQKAGQAHWVQANQGLLEQKVLPSIELLQQGQTISKEDKYVREYTPEEWAARQAVPHQEASA